MQYTTAFLRTKVARRILLLFGVCALLPILVLGYVAHRQVTEQLMAQSREELRQASKSVGMGILQRLIFAETELAMVAVGSTTADEVGSRIGVPEIRSGRQETPSETRQRFGRITRVDGRGRAVPLRGEPIAVPEFDAEARAQLAAGESVLQIREGEAEPTILLVRAVEPEAGGGALILGDVNPSYLWGSDPQTGEPSPELPPNTDLCVLARSGSPLGCTVPEPSVFQREAAESVSGAGLGHFEWTDGRGEQLAGYWTLFLKPDFLYPGWTVAVTEDKSQVLQPIAQFEKRFLLVLLLTLAVVLTLSNVQIRRSLVPLEKLWEGTKRVAARNFGEPVEVETDDEFGELAASFNAMATRLERQFQSLSTRGEIDRAILSALDTEAVIQTVLERMDDLVSCDVACLALLEEGREGRFYVRSTGSGEGVERQTTEVAPALLEGLEGGEDHLVVNGDRLPVRPGDGEGPSPQIETWELFPIRLDGEPAGLLGLGYGDSSGPGEGDRAEARRLADQVAVALSNARLLDELDQMTWGALTALARTIDAKSPWTAGHAERVTALTLRLGEELGLDEEELEVVQRGALLHDIGKIGVPAEILDKDRELGEEEEGVMRLHPELGARILEPIPQYGDIIPMVLHHHERYDGTGYPEGLEGTEIPYHARLLAVADVFDAMTSDRPYRVALSHSEAMAHLEDRAGILFDAEVVEAFHVVVQELERGGWSAITPDEESAVTGIGEREVAGGRHPRRRRATRRETTHG